MPRVAVAATLVVAMLAGCASLPPPASAPGDAAAGAGAQRLRATALGLAEGECAAPAWSMAGRVALSNGKDGGSGRIDWSQGSGHVEVSLSAPITRQSWTLSLDDGDAMLAGVPNGPLHGTDAGELLRAATGWDIPVAALGCWLRGIQAKESIFGENELFFAENGLLQRIEQGGWTIDFEQWTTDPASGQPVPVRIDARRGQDRVRLIVDSWGGE